MLPLAFLLTFHLTPQTAADYKQPQLAATADLVAATFGSGDAVYFSASRDRGKTFSEPVKVGSAGALMLGMHRGPRIAIAPAAIVISAVDRNKGDLLTWRSLDGGKSWLAGNVINDVPSSAREGLHAMTAGPNGLLFAAWLDLRVKGTRLYGASSSDGGATWSKNVAIYESPDGTICQCCHPSLAIGGHGEIYAMWRNFLGGSRDMYVASSGDGGKTFAHPEKQGAGTWPLNACPMDGGGVALTSQGKVIDIWRRAGNVYLAPEGGVETLIASGKNPAIAANEAGVYAAWQGVGDGLHARIPGKPEPVLIDSDPDSAYPQLVAIPNGPVITAWEKKGSIHFLTLQ